MEGQEPRGDSPRGSCVLPHNRVAQAEEPVATAGSL